MQGRDNTHGVNDIGPPLVLLVLLKVLIFPDSSNGLPIFSLTVLLRMWNTDFLNLFLQSCDSQKGYIQHFGG